MLALVSLLARRVRVRVELGDELGMDSCLLSCFSLVRRQTLMRVNRLHLTVRDGALGSHRHFSKAISAFLAIRNLVTVLPLQVAL